MASGDAASARRPRRHRARRPRRRRDAGGRIPPRCDRADREEARRLIELFLAPDRAGTPHALARRMGVEEIIWDCSYWAAGLQDFVAYRPCLDEHGELRRHVNPTIAHRNHIHFGLSIAGAMGRTSFWP